MNPVDQSNDYLQTSKLEYMVGILYTITALIKETKRTDGITIINHAKEELEQINVAAMEQGKRAERTKQKFIEEHI